MVKSGILFFAGRLPPLIGGVEIHAKYFIEYFINHTKFPIAGVVTKNSKNEDCLVISRTIRVINISEIDNLFNPDVIFFNDGRWVEDFIHLRNMFPRTKFIYRTGGNEILKAPLLRKRIPSLVLRQSYWVDSINNNIDLLITNSAYTETRLNRIGIKCLFKRSVGGVNIAAIKSANIAMGQPFTIFCAARFVPYKNHSLMVLLVHKLVSRGYYFKVRLAGDGPLLKQIKKQVYENNLGSVIKFLGVLENEKICSEINNANIYLQLSSDKLTRVRGGSYIHSEGMGRSILEALTAGTYVIAGNSGALSEIVTPDRGVLVDLDNFTQTANQIEKVLKSPPIKKPLTDKFCWSKIFKGYEKLFKKY